MPPTHGAQSFLGRAQYVRTVSSEATAASSAQGSHQPHKQDVGSSDTMRRYSDENPGEAKEPRRGGRRQQRFSNRLLIDDKDAKPGLQALDELSPAARSTKRRALVSSDPQALRAWQSIVDSVQNSFTVTQLRDMAREARIGGPLLQRQRRAIKAGTINKHCYARALVISRFGFQDPNEELRLRAEAAKTGATEVQRSLVQPMPTHALQLLLIFGREESRTVLQRHRVTLQPTVQSGQDGDMPYGVTLGGSDAGLEAVRAWLDQFVQSIASTSIPLPVVAAASETLHIPTRPQLSAICRQANALITIGEAPEHIVTIHAVTAEASQIAQMLLARHAHMQSQMLARQHYSLASSAMPLEGDVSVPTYAFSPYVSPTSPAAAAGNSAEEKGVYFRLARQDMDNSRNVWSATDFRNSVRLRPIARSKQQPILSDTQNGDSDCLGALSALLEHGDAQSTPLPNASNTCTTYAVHFGHHLFSGNADEQQDSLVDHFLASPVDGSWPLEHAMEWMRKDFAVSKGEHAQKEGVYSVSGSRTPTFVPSVPPLMYQADMHTLASMVKSRRSSLVWQRLLTSVESGLSLQENLYELANSVDWNSCEVHGEIQVRYRSASGQVMTTHYAHDSSVQGDQGQDEYVEEGHPPRITSKDEESADSDVAKDKMAEEAAFSAANDPLAEKKTASSENGKLYWRLARATIVRTAEADVLVPEAVTDMRLSAEEASDVSVDAVAPHTSVQSFAAALNESGYSLERLARRRRIAAPPVPPVRLDLDGEGFSLFDARIVERSSWCVKGSAARERAEESTATAERFFVMETLKALDGTEATPSVKVSSRPRGVGDKLRKINCIY